jgi:phosphoserine phosphatase
MQQRIAFFDFDGTITTRDTLLEFIKFSKGKPNFYVGFLLNSPWLVAFKCKLISNQTAKERILRWFFRGQSLDDFQQRCDQFARIVIPGLLRPKALQEVARLQAAGATVVIVSASPGNWIRGWADTLNLALIATRLETTPAVTGDGPTSFPVTGGSPSSHPSSPAPKLTGKIAGNNCYGEEKVRRIREIYTLSEYADINTYGDSSGDLPMLKLGTNSFFKPFR